MQSEAIPVDVLRQSRMLAQSQVWLIGVPQTADAMFWWGAFTSWCTAYDTQIFEAYSQRGDLIVFRDLVCGGRWMLHSENGEFRDRDNRLASWRGFLMRNPDLSGLFLANLKSVTEPTVLMDVPASLGAH